jgi:phosphodiester glycosidase
MDRICAALIVIWLFAPASVADVSTTRPMPGIALERDVQTNPPMRFYVVTVDLTNPRIHLKVSRAGDWQHLPRPWEVKLMTVSEMAQRDGLSIAVNGNLFECSSFESIPGVKFPYFWGNFARACGWAMSDGLLFSGSPVDMDWPSLIVNDRGKIAIGRLERIPLDARQIVSGIWQIVTDGRDTVGGDAGRTGELAPHAAVGIDRDGKTLMFFVVDGRRPTYSVGMSWHQIAREMISRGAWNTLLLDGGGSTTLVMRNPRGKADVVNLPSDGHDLPGALSIQRCVANALGVVIDGAATQP